MTGVGGGERGVGVICGWDGGWVWVAKETESNPVNPSKYKKRRQCKKHRLTTCDVSA